MKRTSYKIFLLGLLITFSFCFAMPSFTSRVEKNSENLDIDFGDDLIEIKTSAYTWLSTEVISTESTLSSYYAKIAIDNSGNLHLVWHDLTNINSSGADRDIFYEMWNITTGSWTPTNVISTESTTQSYEPSLAVDNQGNVHVAWHDITNLNSSGTDDDIFYKRWNATTGVWTNTEVVSTNSSLDSTVTSIAVDIFGNIHIVWQDLTNYSNCGTDDDIFYKRWNATLDNWTITEVVSNESTDSSLSPSIAIDNSGNAHVVWYDITDYNNSGTDEDIFYKCWNATLDNWTTTEVVSTGSTGNSRAPSIECDGSDNLHVVWADQTGPNWDIYYRCYNATLDNWTTIDVISTESTSISANPSVVADSSGNVHIAWRDTTNYLGCGIDSDVFYKHWNVSTDTWSIADVVSTESDGESMSPSIIVDNSGSAHVAWYDNSDWDLEGDFDVFYKKFIQIFPNSNHPQDFTTNSTGKETINWTLSADYGGGVYQVLANDTTGSTYTWIDWTSWTNNSVNYIPVNRSLPGIFNYTIFFNDSHDLWGTPDSVIVTVLDESPTSNSPANILTTSTGDETINWTLTDDYGVANYTVLANDTAGSTYTWIPWTSWSNGTTYNIPINRTLPGVFNYTILYNDSLNQFGIQDTVIVTVQNSPPTSDTPTDVITSKAGSEVITWTLWDDYGNGQYRVIANDTLGSFYVWQDWIGWGNNTPFDVQINRTLPGIFNYTIEYNDTYGILGTPDTVIVTISDNPPQSNHPTSITTFQNEDSYIPWILTDDFGSGYYRVFINGTPGSWDTWDNNTVLNYQINTAALGFFNYTIQFNTSTGQIGYDTVIIEICESLGNGGPPDGGIDMFIIIIIIIIGVASSVSFLAIVMVRKSREKLRDKEAEVELLLKQRDELTDDDILISKERHICLVHKGPIEGYSYICPECGSYYCVKCVEAIKKTADECWSCGVSLDPEKAKAGLKKPKKIKEVEEKIEVEEDFEFDVEKPDKKAPLKAPKDMKAKPGLTPLPTKPPEKEQKLTIRAPSVEKPKEEVDEETLKKLMTEPEPQPVVPTEALKKEASITKLEAIKKFDDYIEQLNTMVQKLDIKFSAGVITQEQYIEKKTMLAEKLGEAMAKRDQLKENLSNN